MKRLLPIMLLVVFATAVPNLATAQDFRVLWDDPTTRLPDPITGHVEPFDPATEIREYNFYVDDALTVVPAPISSYEFTVTAVGIHEITMEVVSTDGEVSAKVDPPLAFTVSGTAPAGVTNLRFGQDSGGANQP